MTLFRSRAGSPAAGALQGAEALAQMAALGVGQQRAVHDARREADQLHAALHSRVVIEQAKGILAHHGDRSPDEAFGALRAHSRNRNRKLHATAEALISGELSCADILGDRAGAGADAPGGDGEAGTAQPGGDGHLVAGPPHRGPDGRDTAARVRAAVRRECQQTRRCASDHRLTAGQLRRHALHLRERAALAGRA